MSYLLPLVANSSADQPVAMRSMGIQPVQPVLQIMVVPRHALDHNENTLGNFKAPAKNGLYFKIPVI